MPIIAKDNILVMEYIGGEQPAPKLKHQEPENIKKFYKDIAKSMQKLYRAKLIHADLSPFNILNHNEKVVFIDMSQSTPLDDPNSNEYLERDARNIANYFIKKGIETSAEDLKKIIISK